MLKDYYITDGTRYIYKDFKGKYIPTYNKSMGELFTKHQAESIINNSLPKAMRKLFRDEKATLPEDNIKMVSIIDLQQTEKVKSTNNIQHWIQRLKDLNGLATDASRRKNQLLTQLSNVEKEIMDILHYIEFVNLNASQGYKAYKMIKEKRIVRRSLKNELSILDLILGKKISETVEEEIEKRLDEMDNRKYEPRVLKELFDV